MSRVQGAGSLAISGGKALARKTCKNGQPRKVIGLAQDFSRYSLGAVVPLDYRRKPLAEPIEPEWYILTTPSMRETAACAWLTRIGAAEAWFPVETRWRILPRVRRKVSYDVPIAPGYVFVQFDRRPVWDVLFEQSNGRVISVVSMGETPYRVPEDVIAKMAQVPALIEVRRRQEEERLRRERDAMKPRVGEKARILEGPLAGMLVYVTGIHRGIVYFILGSARGEISEDRVVRAEPGCQK